MTSPTAYSRLARTQSRGAANDPCQPCPVCHGLECLCRPRFFAGQLLTEADLNRLEKYIVDKNKLHNRFVHGWGVACGLEVVCDPCGNSVIVRPGYALSPCGDDIVVCEDAAVDICSLINGCCQQETPECEPPRPRPAGCDDLERQWVLWICYEEYASRNLPSLTASCQAPKSSCGCGGKSSGKGCTCNGQASQAAGSRTSRTRQPVQCEPALTCESYKFMVTPVDRSEKTDRGALVERFLACVRRFTQGLPTPPGANATVAQIQTWCCEVREALLNAMAGASVTECSVYEQLQTMCPTPSPNTTPQQYLNQISQTLVALAVRHLQACLCSALLPPCPGGAESNCVPIATVTVKGSQCRVVRICNLEGRKFLTTFPNLQYWMSWLPFTRRLRELLERLCCNPLRIPQVGDVRPGTTTVPIGVSTNPQRPGTFATAATAAYSRRNSEAPKGFSALGFDVLGLSATGKPYSQAIDIDEPAMSLLLEELALPLVLSELPAGLGDTTTPPGTPGRTVGGISPAADLFASFVSGAYEQKSEVDQLRATVTELQEQLKKQELMIDALIRRMPKTGGEGKDR